MMTLYQTPFCPYCAKVREAITSLGLDVTIVDAPKGTPEREKMVELGGKHQVPFLVDDTDTANTVMMYESADIISYLQSKKA